jgi:hypothetical protein
MWDCTCNSISLLLSFGLIPRNISLSLHLYRYGCMVFPYFLISLFHFVYSKLPIVIKDP